MVGRNIVTRTARHLAHTTTTCTACAGRRASTLSASQRPFSSYPARPCSRLLDGLILERKTQGHCRAYRHYSIASTPLSQCPTCSESLPEASAASPILAHCPSCNAFLPPVSAPDYFHLFGLSKSFSIDKSDLKRSFLQWQGRVHPDRLPASANHARQEDWAKTWSAIVNEGYKTLSSESRRGEYMLKQRGVEIEEQDKMEDPELLMEILEVREALEEATTEEEVTAIREQNKNVQQETLQDLQDCLAESELDTHRSKTLLMRLRYQDNVENVCREWQPGKEIVLQH